MAHDFGSEQTGQSVAAFIEEGNVGVLYDTFAPALMGVIQNMVGDLNISETVLTQTFVEIWRTRRTYDSSRERPFIWMMKIARRAASEAIKSSEEIGDKKNQQANNPVYSIGTDI